MIEVPSKIWRPKFVSKYTTPKLEDESVDDLLDYGQYGSCVYKPKLGWSTGDLRPDFIDFDCILHSKELNKDLSFDPSVDAATRTSITDSIHDF